MVIILLALFLTLAVACAQKTSTQTQKVYDITVTFSTEPLLPKVGDNILKIKIVNSQGVAVTDARVNFVYSIFPQKRQKGKPEGIIAGIQGSLNEAKEYVARVKLEMDGEWKVLVKIDRPGKHPICTGFQIDVR